MGLSGRKGRNNWCCTICGEKYDWKQPNRLVVVHSGESIDQVKVFKAHAVPQGSCANFINALELLANQQEYGDCLFPEHRGAEKVSRTVGENSQRLTMSAPLNT